MEPISARTRLNEKLHEYHLAKDLSEKERVHLHKSRDHLLAVEQAQAYLQDIAQQVQTLVHKKVAKVVSRCLSAVFAEPYELRIEFEQKRGKTEAKFVYLRGGRKVNPRVTSGGVREVTSLALRLVSLVMGLPARRRLLILDEPFGGLSKENLIKVSKAIEALAEDLDVQFILVSHNDALKLGKVIQL